MNRRFPLCSALPPRWRGPVLAADVAAVPALERFQATAARGATTKAEMLGPASREMHGSLTAATRSTCSPIDHTNRCDTGWTDATGVSAGLAVLDPYIRPGRTSSAQVALER